MENLDELMRKKFESDRPAERFEFREEYWEQAQALIEAEEKRRRKRRRWLFWCFFSGVVAIAVVVAVAVGSEQPTVTHGDDSNPQPAGTEDIRVQSGDVAKNVVAEEKIPGTDPAYRNNKIENQGIEIKNGNRDTAGAPERQRGKGSERTGAQQSAASQNAPPALPSGIGKPTRPPANQPDSMTGKDGSPKPGNEQVGNVPVPYPSDSTNAAVAAQNNPYDFNALSALPALLRLLDLPARELDTPFATPYIGPIKPLREQKISFGLAAAGSLSQVSPDGKRMGAVGGLFAHYRFATSWSLTAGLQWRFLRGEWVNDTMPSESVQLRYSFGYQQDEWRLETRGLHFIEVPVGLRWRRGAFAAEGGFTPGFLLGVQGRMIHQQSESLQGASTERSRVWMNKTPYYRFSPALFLGGEWRMMQRLGLTLRGTYRPGTFGENLSPDEPVPANVFWLDAGLRWYF